MIIVPTPTQLKSLPTRGIFNNPSLWLNEKADFDSKLHGSNQKYWYVDNRVYDLNNFIKSHPGGEHWLERTRGQDVTELFYTHHLNEAKAKSILNKYEVDTTCNTITRFTFKPEGFYQTVKREILSKYSVQQLQDSSESKALTFKVLTLFISLFLLLCYTRSYILAAVCGFLMVSIVGLGHNFMHQKKNAFRYLFAVTGFIHEDWQNFHAISHHMQPNTELDYEIAAFEPLAHFLRNQKNNSVLTELYLQPFFFVMVPLNMIIKIVFAIINPSKKFTMSLLYPWTEVVILYLFKQDLVESLSLFFFMQACFGFSLTKCIFCGHRTQEMWSAGSERIEDFGEHTVASTCDTTTHLRGFLSMALFAGFNQHISHHLFPTVDHSHLDKLLPIIKETMKQFGLTYNCKSKWECMVSISKAIINRIPYKSKAV